MNFLCECGQHITDTTDYISYKAHLMPDQDLFDYYDELDTVIENIGLTKKDKEDAMMKLRILSNKYTKTVYQCNSCGNIFFSDKSPQLKVFRSCTDDSKKGLLQSVKGDKWQGFMYGEWVDEKPVWSEKNGYICAPTIIEGKQYDNWEALERDYYNIFRELKVKNVLRSSSLKKNRITIHTWRLDNEE